FFQDQTDTSSTKFAKVLGTADYLSPEQAINSDQADIRADIYSLGATFYYLLTGRPPFEETTLTRKLIAHQMKMPRPLPEVRAEVPAELAEVVFKMMAKAPAQRYQTPAEVVSALVPWTGTPLTALPLPESSRLSPAARSVRPGSGGVPTIPTVP